MRLLRRPNERRVGQQLPRSRRSTLRSAQSSCTIEGVSHRMRPLTSHPRPAAASSSEGGAQCGICTPGMILATHHLLQQHPQPTLLQIQEGLGGNLCRCTGYMRIFAAVEKAVADLHAAESA